MNFSAKTVFLNRSRHRKTKNVGQFCSKLRLWAPGAKMTEMRTYGFCRQPPLGVRTAYENFRHHP